MVPVQGMPLVLRRFVLAVAICVSWGNITSLQYSFDDFAISQVAKVLGKTNNSQKVLIPSTALSAVAWLQHLVCQYTQRAQNFLNVWDPTVKFTEEHFDLTGMVRVVRNLNYALCDCILFERVVLVASQGRIVCLHRSKALQCQWLNVLLGCFQSRRFL